MKFVSLFFIIVLAIMSLLLGVLIFKDLPNTLIFFAIPFLIIMTSWLASLYFHRKRKFKTSVLCALSIPILLFVMIALIVNDFYVAPAIADRQKAHKEWSERAKPAIKNAMGWLSMVKEINANEKEEAIVAVGRILEEFGDIDREERSPSHPKKAYEQLEVIEKIHKIYDETQRLKQQEFALLEFALINNDTELAEKAYVLVALNQPRFKYIAAALLAEYHAINSNCPAAKTHLKTLSELRNADDFLIIHSEYSPREYVQAQRTARIWANATLICNSLRQSLSILAKHFPMSLTNDQFILETYIDYALALDKSGYKEDAEKFYRSAKKIFEEGYLYNKSTAHRFLTLYKLQSSGVDAAALEFKNYREEIIQGGGDASKMDMPVLGIIINEFIYSDRIEKAIDMMTMSIAGNPYILSAALDEASRKKETDDFIQFLDKLVERLLNESPFNNHFLYRPLLKAAIFYNDYGYTDKANEIEGLVIDYLENDERANERWQKRSLIEFLSEYYAYKGQSEKIKKLISSQSDVSKHTYRRALGVLYGYFIYNDEPEQLDEVISIAKDIGQELGHFSYYAAMYLIEKRDWNNAETLINEFTGVNTMETLKSSINEKMGISLHHYSHIKSLTTLPYGRISIINEKICKEYGECD